MRSIHRIPYFDFDKHNEVNHLINPLKKAFKIGELNLVKKTIRDMKNAHFYKGTLFTSVEFRLLDILEYITQLCSTNENDPITHWTRIFDILFRGTNVKLTNRTSKDFFPIGVQIVDYSGYLYSIRKYNGVQVASQVCGSDIYIPRTVKEFSSFLYNGHVLEKLCSLEMSGFFGSNDSKSRWGGLLKQAISNVETTFDSLLEQPQPSSTTSNKDTETETYMDPISGMVTTIERPRTAPPQPQPTKTTEKVLVESRSSTDLSSRLAAVMEKKKNAASRSVQQNDTTAVIEKTFIETAVVEKLPIEEETAVVEKPVVAVTAVVEKLPIEEETAVVEKPVVAVTAVVEKKPVVADTVVVEKKPINDTKEENAVIIENVQQAVEPVAEEIEVEETEKEPKVDEPVVKEPTEPPAQATDEEPVLPPVAIETKLAHDAKDLILEQRETQLLQAMETIAKLHDQMHQLQEESDTKEQDLKSHIHQLESQESSPANMTKTIKRLETTLEELKKQSADKDEKILGLMQEGEKLSKVELRHSNLIKKLRLEKQDSDKLTLELQKKLEKVTSDLTQATERGTKQSETEKRLQDSVKLLSDLTEQQTKHINQLESEKITRTKKQTETEVALKNALDSMEEERVKAKFDAEQVNAAALEKEIKANDRLHKELTKLKQDAESLETKLRQEMRELQIVLQTTEEQAGVREDDLRKEVNDLQTKLQRADSQMVDISTSVEEATAPLLRQIEELQTQHAIAIKNRDQTEQSMIIRMQIAETEHKKALEKEEKLQLSIDSLHQRLEQSNLDLEKAQSQVDKLKQQIEQDEVKITQLKEQNQRLISEKNQLLEQKVKEQEVLKSQYQRLMKERLNEEKKQFELKLKSERSAAVAANDDSSTRSSFDSNSTSTPVISSIITERLQANIRQLENQLNFYQTQLQSSSQTRDELSDEILCMSQELDTLRKQLKKSNQVETQYQELNARYQTLLELLGERTEEVEELKADLADVKEMYKSQILELVQLNK
ncbi:hypothetical protein HPULCUR_007716 [Helicostylum pulchrum]|uniref:TATA element modulatory factor 1 TATA binding domain-containing protein n=1 Tax=Helicostylum pulchrum TaxID=562976 RepID=A0ABP9Y6M4_9FUNG